jgi:parvulin-like peptidyl-prolyl isomerase
MQAPVGQWSGPVSSGFGVHLVRVEQAEAGALPALQEIRPAVEREWQSQQRRQAKDELLRQLRSKYVVTIEGPLGEALREAKPAESKP